MGLAEEFPANMAWSKMPWVVSRAIARTAREPAPTRPTASTVRVPSGLSHALTRYVPGPKGSGDAADPRIPSPPDDISASDSATPVWAR